MEDVSRSTRIKISNLQEILRTRSVSLLAATAEVATFFLPRKNVNIPLQENDIHFIFLKMHGLAVQNANVVLFKVES